MHTVIIEKNRRQRKMYQITTSVRSCQCSKHQIVNQKIYKLWKNDFEWIKASSRVIFQFRSQYSNDEKISFIEYFIYLSDFIDEQAELAQSRMEQTMRSQHNKHFMNLDESAKSLVEFGDSSTDNTLPVTLEAIAKSEKHPPPSEVNGIDLKVLYQMLANMTAGHPVDDLESGPTKDFLKQCYAVRKLTNIFYFSPLTIINHDLFSQELIESVPEMDSKGIKSMLTEQHKQTQPVYSWLCNSDYSQYILRFLKENSDENDDDDE